MKKKIALLLAIAMCASGVQSVYAKEETPEARAQALYNLGLFKGSDNGFELENNATRGQIAITLIRLMGKEAKAQMQINTHPFYDVPQWADKSIAWLYENYYINGVEWNEYGFEQMASPQQFVTMLLRTLGYSDTNGLDFTYDNALGFAQSIGLVSNAEKYNTPTLSRADMVSLAYEALCLPIKNSRRTLARKLCDERIFSEDEAVKAGVLSASGAIDYFGSTPVNLGTLKARAKSNVVTVSLDTPCDSYALKVYYSKDGGMYQEMSQTPTADGTPYCSFDDIRYGGPGNSISYLYGFSIYNMRASESEYSVVIVKMSGTSYNSLVQGRSEEVKVSQRKGGE